MLTFHSVCSFVLPARPPCFRVQIEAELIYWPNFTIHKCKQRITKITQYLIKMRKMATTQQPTLVGIKKKLDRRDRAREVKALSAAKLERSIETELLSRLKSKAYGDAPLNVNEDVWQAVLERERLGDEVGMEELEDEDSGDEDEDEMEGEAWDEDDEGGTREFVEDDSDLEEGMSDLEDWSGEDGEEVSQVRSPPRITVVQPSLTHSHLVYPLLKLSSMDRICLARKRATRRTRRTGTTRRTLPPRRRTPRASARRLLLQRRLPPRPRRPRRVGPGLGWRSSTSRRWRRSPCQRTCSQTGRQQHTITTTILHLYDHSGTPLHSKRVVRVRHLRDVALWCDLSGGARVECEFELFALLLLEERIHRFPVSPKLLRRRISNELRYTSRRERSSTW